MSTADPVLTIREAAEELRRNYKTVLRLVKTGELAAVKRGGRYYVRRSAIDTFLTPPR
jgi:excisionase family DNA binding protein